MEDEWHYDTDPIFARRMVAWRAVQIHVKPGSDINYKHWQSFKQIMRIIGNLDALIQKLHLESVACRRKNIRTTKYKHTIRQIEQTIDEIEQLVTMYGLEFF